ncbi:MAG: hypothetical protein AAF841_14755, partial [Pseudomonadota bacterium]
MCLTMGLRPRELRATAQSMGDELRYLPVLAVNDFGDQETNDTFHDVFPRGRLIDLGGHVGHIKALRALYREVETPYVFHCEDDWTFTRSNFLDECIAILDQTPEISQVVLRKADDIRHAREAGPELSVETHAGTEIFRLDDRDEVWFCFTFNPHVARLSDWQSIISRRQLRGEKPASRRMRNRG